MSHSPFLFSMLAAAFAAQLIAVRRLDAGRIGSRTRLLSAMAFLAPGPGMWLAILAMFPAITEACETFLTSWDRVLSSVIVGLVLSGVLYALVAWLVRWAALQRLRANAVAAGPRLSGIADRISPRLRITSPEILVINVDRPVAMAAAGIRPRVFLSAWMITYLDEEELEAVVAHELGHVALQHHIAAFASCLLRDAAWYLPTSWVLRRRLHAGRESSADSVAVTATGKPLALASALLRVWEANGPRVTPAAAVALLGQPDELPRRIQSLLDLDRSPEPLASEPMGPRFLGGVSRSLLTLHVLALVMMLPLLGCAFGPGL